MSRFPKCKLIARYGGHAKAHMSYRAESGLYGINDHEQRVTVVKAHAGVKDPAPRL
jgi:hypothetical protein